MKAMTKTARGYDFFELLSALQKCIRRNMEYEAVHFAVELEEFNHKALWNRLKIIASEDIGCANPLMPLLIETLHKQYSKAKEKLNDNSYRLFLVNAVVCLCRSPKSRIADDLLKVVYIERQLRETPQIPNFALDMHTKRGRERNRGIEHFYNEGAKLENEAFPNPYTQKAKELETKNEKPA
jgi:replication-associated recombination protein RarA